MIRTILLTALLVATMSIHALRAQEIYTPANLPTPGLKYKTQFAQPFGVDPQSGGSARAWDFRTLIPIIDSAHDIQALNPKDVPGVKPAGTSVVIVNERMGTKLFLNTSTSRYIKLGEEKPSESMNISNNSSDIGPLPIVLNKTVIDDFTALITYTLKPDELTHRTGTISVTGDGNGSLNLPGVSGLTPNAVRIRVVEDFIDTTFRMDQPLYLARWSVTRYIWFESKSAEERLVINRGDVRYEQISEPPPPDSAINVVTYSSSTSSTSVNDDGFTNDLELYPNPAQNNLSLRILNDRPTSAAIRISNLLGEEVLNVAKGELQFPLTFDIASLAAGEYIVVVDAGTKRLFQKFSVAR